MDREIGNDTLMLIPCCASKSSGGRSIAQHVDPLSKMVSSDSYLRILAARQKALRETQKTPKFMAEKYAKNARILEGPDLGGSSVSGRYTPALDRYTGTLYSVPKFKASVEEAISAEGAPQILILSALYGPLHPRSEIQDYNLQMSDAPAKVWTDSFPPFLEDYVRRNGVKKICLYVGTATFYFKVAKRASEHLLAKGLITQAVQYHVVEGSTRNTPLQHGSKLLSDLARQKGQGASAWPGIQENRL